MTQHDHAEYVYGCYRCELASDETADTVIEQAARRLAWAMADADGIHPGDFETDPFDDLTDDAQRDVLAFARALHAAGLLADPADRDAMEVLSSRMLTLERERNHADVKAERAQATVEHITELAFEHNGCSGCQTPWWLRQALGSDFTPSLTLSPAEQVEALTTRAERAEAEVAELRQKLTAAGYLRAALDGGEQHE